MTAQRIRLPLVWKRWGWLVESVAQRHGVAVVEILGRGRGYELVAARRDLCACLRGSGLSYPAVGRLLGLDHTTVMAAVKKDLAA